MSKRILLCFVLALFLVIVNSAFVLADNFTSSGNANLTVNNTAPQLAPATITFNATYVNASDGTLITGASCNLTLSNTSTYSMVELATTYQVNLSFDVGDMYAYNVTCNHPNFTWLNVSDMFGIMGMTNLSVNKTSAQPAYNVTDVFEFTINITNIGTDIIDSMTLNDSYNASIIQFNSSSCPILSNGTGWFTINFSDCYGGPFAPDDSFEIDVNFTFNFSASAPINATNTVTINESGIWSDNATIELYPGPGGSGELVVDKTSTQPAYNDTDVIQFVINITNNGTIDVDNIIVDENWNQTRLVFNSSSCDNYTGNFSQGWLDINVSACLNDTLDPDVSYLLYLNFTTNRLPYDYNVTNYVEVNGTDAAFDETNDSDNATVEIFTTRAGQVNVTKYSAQPKYNDTDIIQFVINVSNTGDVGLFQVNLSDDWNASRLVLDNISCGDFLDANFSEGWFDLNVTGCIGGNVLTPGNFTLIYVNFTSAGIPEDFNATNFVGVNASDALNQLSDDIDGAQVEVLFTGFINMQYFEDDFMDNDTLVGIDPGLNIPYPFDLFANASASGNYSVSISHGGICSFVSDPFLMTFDPAEGDFNTTCYVNKTRLVEGVPNVVNATAYLDMYPSINDSLSFTFYADFTRPDVIFNWRNTTDHSTGDPIRIPEPHQLLANPDFFFSPEDKLMIVSINATDDMNISFASAQWDNMSNFPCNTTNLSYNPVNGLWEGNCSLGTFDLSNLTQDEPGSRVQSATAVITVYDEAGNRNNMYNSSINNTAENSTASVCPEPGNQSDCVPPFSVILIHDLGVPEPEDNCSRFGPLTTNLSDEFDFADMNMVFEVQLNLSCETGSPFLPDDFNTFVMINFSSLDLEDESVALKLARLGEALDLVTPEPQSFGDAYIYVNTTFFSELNSLAEISFYHLPFLSEPAVLAGAGAAGVNASTISWSPGFDSVIQSFGGNLSFVVLGFSNYNATDNVSPIITHHFPLNNTNYSSNISFINVSVNGTGTEPSLVRFFVDGAPVALFNNTQVGVNTANCVGIGTNETYLCTFGYNISDGSHSLTVYAYDYGGSAPGNNETSAIFFGVDATDPVINNTAPPDGSFVAGDSVNLTYVPVDTHLDSCTVFFNRTGALESAAGTASNGTNNTYTLDISATTSGFPVTWFVSCNDTFGNVENGSTWYFISDKGAPSFVTLQPANNSVSSGQVQFLGVSQDPLSGVQNISLYVDGSLNASNASGNFTSALLTLSPGYHSFFFRTYDNVGNVNTSGTFSVLVDIWPPEFVNISPANNSIFNSSTVLISAQSTDNSTVNLTQLFVDGSLNATNASANLSASVAFADGQYTFYFTATDEVNNTNTSGTRYIIVDTVAPATTDDAPAGWQNAAFNVTLNATDLTSGVNFTSYRVDGGAWVNGTVILVNTSGNHTINYYSVDNAGNVEMTHTVNALLDVTPPTTTDDAPIGWQNAPFNVTLNATDNESGVAYTSYKVDGGAFQNGTVISITTDGNHTINYYSVDNVGNVEATRNTSAALDTTPPVISGLVVQNVTNVSANFNFTSDENATCKVNLGTTVAYGIDTPTSFGTGHFVSVAALSPGTLYHYRANCTDPAGNSAVTGDNTFTTTLVESQSVTNGTTTTFDFNVSENGGTRIAAEVQVNTNQNLTVTISGTPTTSNPSGVAFGVTELGRYITLESDQLNTSTLNWVVIRIYYNDSDLPAGTSESDLRLYWFNTGTNKWEAVTPGGVNTTANYVWGNTTHFSDWGIGIQGGGTPSGPSGGGGGSPYYPSGVYLSLQGQNASVSYSLSSLDTVYYQPGNAMGDYAFSFMLYGDYTVMNVKNSVKGTTTAYNLNPGNEVRLDLDQDGDDDLRVLAGQPDYGKVAMTFSLVPDLVPTTLPAESPEPVQESEQEDISTAAPEPEPQREPVQREVVPEKKEAAWSIAGITIIAALVLLIAGLVLHKTIRKK